jgi:penicillin V acylase-like amidase (Ntn superfamily)
VANLLYLVESEYVKPGANDKRRPLAISAWCQYLLDNYATVAEAVAAVEQEPFYVLPMTTPDGKPGTMHLAPNVFWVNLADLDFAEGAPVKKLKISDGAVFAGNTAGKFQKAEAFKFLPASIK